MVSLDEVLYKNKAAIQEDRADRNLALYREEKRDHWATKRERDSAVEESERRWAGHQRDRDDLALAKDRIMSLSKMVVELSRNIEIAKGTEEALRILLDEKLNDDIFLSKFGGELSEADVDALTLMKQRAWGLSQLAGELLKDRAPN